MNRYSDLPRRCIIASPFSNKPISSYGILVIARETNRCLLVQGNYSLGLSYLMHGYYKPVHFEAISSYLTKEEVYFLQKLVSLPKLEGIKLFNQKYLEMCGSLPSSVNAYQRLTDIKQDILDIDYESALDSPLFGIPKGKKLHMEKYEDAAKREFNEETGFNIKSLDKAKLIKYRTPGITGIDYELNCWLYVVDKEFELDDSRIKDKREISRCEWVEIPRTGDSFIEGEFHKGKVGNQTVSIDNQTVVIINKYYYN